MLLGLLLRHANNPVPTDRLIDELWGDGRPPSSAAANLRVYVHKLRKALGDEARITFDRHGYALTVHPDELDAQRFEDLVRDGRRTSERGDARGASSMLREALDLWRGPAYAELTECPVLRDEAARLDELRLAALEARVDAELSLGLHAELIPELWSLVAEHTLRERFRAQLMLALYRADRQAEALQAYQDARRVLDEELGIEPGPKLRRLHESILAGDPALDLPVAKTVPAGLPPDVGTFTGRQDDLDRLAAELRGAGPGPLVICALAGSGGIGKSALAIRAAHLVADRFPDGQLYVDLHGATPGLLPLTPDKVLGRFLRSLGGEGESHVDDVDEAAERFRSATADRRVLVVLDNAADAAQVRPLLPGGPGCAVLITCRRVLSALDGAVHLRLEALPEADAVALLARFTDPDRVAADPDAAAEIVRLCGYLPLAVRIAAARLAARRDWSLAAFADRLASARNRLDELQHADLEVRTSFAVAQGGGSGDSGDLFTRLGLLDLPDITAPVAAVLADWPVERAQAALDSLLDSQLLDVPVADRFRMHDLVRLHAREQATEHLPEPERHAAVIRVLYYHLATARRAIRIFDHTNAYRAYFGLDREFSQAAAPLSSRKDVIDWIDAEGDNLVALTRQAVDMPGDGPAIAVGLSTALSWPFEVRGHWTEWVSTAELCLHAAALSDDDKGRAHAHSSLGLARSRGGRLDEAARHHREALALWRKVGDRSGEARALNNIGIVLGQQGDLTGAVAHFEESLEIRKGRDDPHIVQPLINLGIAHRKLGNLDPAIHVLERALDVVREQGNILSEGDALGILGGTLRVAGRIDEAIAILERAITLVRDGGDRVKEAEFHWELGLAFHSIDKNEQARPHWAESVAILQDMGALTANEARDILDSGPIPKTPEPIRLQG